jgi:hypothetical protein
MTKKILIPAIAIGAAVAAWVLSTGENHAAEITVYKSPSCGCCSKWADHLRAGGHTVNVVKVEYMGDIKEKFGIPANMESCHTAKVGDYIVEGHVPAKDIEWLLTQRPDIKGLAVPGMPQGSLGMEGRYKDPYDVMVLKSDGSVAVHAQHR